MLPAGVTTAMAWPRQPAACLAVVSAARLDEAVRTYTTAPLIFYYVVRFHAHLSMLVFGRLERRRD